MATGRIFLGTAGWAVPRAVADLFPSGGSALERYAGRFRAAEINSTFWRRHQPATLERWRKTVPRGFRFAVKLPRAITHERELRAARAPLREFFDDVAALRDRLGPVLVQLPPSLSFERRRVEAFFRTLRALYQGHVACEPRHASWFSAAATAVMAAHGVARVAADPPRVPEGDQPGGSPSLVYFRLHGSPVMYRSAYGPSRLAALAPRLRPAARNTIVWCIFDNTASGAAAADALELDGLLKLGSPGEGGTICR
jgi:uncharacterized protein YecE (DUF72 family)